MANNPQSAQKITEISSNLNKSFAGSINEQLAKFETQTPKDSFKNSFNQVKKDYADTKDFLVKNSNYQSDFKDLNDNLATILSDTQNISTRGVFNALNGGGNLENLLNAKNAINEQLGYIMKADFKSSSDFINQKALNEAKSLIDNEINTALKNDENLINLYKSANGDYATMKNIVDSNLMNQISRDGKTSLEALNAMIKSNENINGVTLNDFLSSLGAKDRAIAEANIIKGLMEKNSVNGVVDFRALNQSLNSLDFGSEFAKELKSQILNRQALLNNTSDILNALGGKVVKSKNMSQGISTDPLKRAETMRANFIVEKLKPLIPRLGNNEALKLHLNRAILNANGDFKLAIKNIDNIPDGNLPTPTRNLLNEFKEAVKEIEKQVVKADNQAENQVNLANQLNGGNIDSLTKQISYLQNALKGDGFVTYPNSARQETAINQNFNIQEWVKNMSGVISDEWRANLTKLANNHPEMFRSEADVFRVIKEIKDNPTHFFKNYDDDIALIGKKLNNNKDGNIGIVKNSGEIIHANKNRSGDLDRLQRKQLKNYEKDGAIAGTPAPATTRPNNGVEGEIIKNRTNAQTIPNQSIKEAENQANLAKKENERLLKRNSYPVGSPTPTQLTFGKTAEPTANGAKALLGKKEKAVSGDALPPHLDADNISLTGRYSVGGKPHLTAFEKGNPQSFTEADFMAKSDNILTNPNKNSTPKELLSQGQMPAGWMKGSTNIGSSTEQPKWANKFKTKMAKMGQEYNDEKIANLANWHKDSHAVTKESDGSPKLFYHGTNAKFDAFDIDKSKGGWLGKSFYFTDSKSKAKGYGKNVISTYLNLKNPYISKANDHYSFVNEVKEQFGVKENYGEFDPAQVLKQHGYDGVVYKDWNDEVGIIYTAFSPNQIKSITNKGTFNPNSNLIDGFSTMAIQKAILHLGSGGIGGAMNANAEQDPNKKAEAFVKGFLLGAGGSVGAIKMLENSAKLAPQLAQVSQRLAKDLPMILNDRPDIIGKALGRTPKENYNYIFGGENAIGANKAKLKIAQEMAKNGADESQIWAKTGWYKDIDKKWKFEINPKGGELKENAISNHITKVKSIEKEISELEKIKDGWGNIEQRIEAGNKINELKKQKDKLQVNVGDILDDKMLFTSYPELKNIQVVFNNFKDEYGASYGGKIELSRFLEPTMMKSVLYHELQHEIQNIERFANGGGYFADKTEVEELLKKYPNDADLKKLYDGLENDYIYEDAEFNVYNKLAGEAEARNVQTRLTANSKEHPNKTLDINPNDRVVKYGSGMSASLDPRQKEVRGVYNVLKNGKQSTRLYKDITADLNAVDNIVKFEKGKKDYRTKTGYKNGYGLEHIKKHLGADKNGYVTEQELLHIGDFMRSGKMSYIKEYKNGKERIKRVYESFDNEGTRFRVLVGENEKGDTTISFFSNRKAQVGFTHNAENYTNNLKGLGGNFTTTANKSQEPNLNRANPRQKAKQYAKWLSQADKIPPQAPDELYKAYDKAKKDLKPKK